MLQHNKIGLLFETVHHLTYFQTQRFRYWKSKDSDWVSFHTTRSSHLLEEWL